MRKKFFLSLLGLCLVLMLNAQNGLKKVYNEDINPIEQIDHAVLKAKTEGKFVICQVGGNWCPWCLRFADFITNDSTISKVIDIRYKRLPDKRKCEIKFTCVILGKFRYLFYDEMRWYVMVDCKSPPE